MGHRMSARHSGVPGVDQGQRETPGALRFERPLRYVDHLDGMRRQFGLRGIEPGRTGHAGASRQLVRRRMQPAQLDVAEVVRTARSTAPVDEHTDAAFVVLRQAHIQRRSGGNLVIARGGRERRVTILAGAGHAELHEHPGRVPALKLERPAGDVLLRRLRPHRAPGVFP